VSFRSPEAAAPETAADTLALDLRWLVRLRWLAVAGGVVLILAARALLGLDLALVPLLSVVAIAGASNLALVLWSRRGEGVRPVGVAGIQALDVVLLTVILHFSGGPLNPFSTLYLVHVALSAVILPPRYTWPLAVMAGLAFGLLFLGHEAADPGAHHHHGHPQGGGEHDHLAMDLHLYGMWVAFGLAAGVIVHFVHRIRGALAAREAELGGIRERHERQTRLAALATLSAGAAHELATPLSTIAVVAKELERALDGEGADDARLIREEVARCQAILAQMSVEAGAEQGAPLERVDPNALVAEALAELPAPRVVAAPPPEAEVAITAPRQPLVRAIRALVRNALDATEPDGAVRVEASLEAGEWRLKVRDEGPGLDPAVAGRIGEPFVTTKPPGKGMGLGLFLARTVVESLGGRLAVHSVLGAGTTAEIRLKVDGGPVRRSAAAETAAVAQGRGTGAPATGRAAS
jgi:two-component system, sensor histidine kinase RegB